MIPATEFVLKIYRGANGPPFEIVFPNIDLTGSSVTIQLTPLDGSTSVTLSTEDGTLTLALPNGVRWVYDEDLAWQLPAGKRTLVDVFRSIGTTTEKLGGGTLYIGAAGEFERLGPVVLEVPGIQGKDGPPGDLTPEAEAVLAEAQSEIDRYSPRRPDFSKRRNLVLTPFFWS